MRLVAAVPGRAHQLPPTCDVVVVGGGVAGISSAVVLAERGARVTLLEAADTLGGRLGAWRHRLPDGTEQVIEHGFHAFFRHYYTWRAVLRRADPLLRFLRPVGSYPVIARQWPDEDLTGLPAMPPLSLLALFARSPSLRWRDVLDANRALGIELLGYHPERTPAALDAIPAADFLDRVNLPQRARTMLFEAFARSFFCDLRSLSAAELVTMFHFYFLGNPAGLAFDAPDTDYLECIWRPLDAYLLRNGASVRTGARALAVRPGPDRRWRIQLDGEELLAGHLVLALDPVGLRTLLDRSPLLRKAAPRLADQVDAVAVAEPYAVSRLWLDRDVSPHRAVFSAVTTEATLDSVACYHRLEAPSREWAAANGGAVLELHSYACTAPDGEQAARRMRAELDELWPETRAARIRHQVTRYEAAAPAFPPGGAARRPGVRTDAPGIRLAGDFVTLPFCAGLMERAAMSGVLAANEILAEEGADAEPIDGVPQRGLLAGLTPFTRPPGARRSRR